MHKYCPVRRVFVKAFLSRTVNGHETWTQSLWNAGQQTVNGKASSSFSPEEDEFYLFLRECHGQSFLNAEGLTLIDIMPRGETIDSNFYINTLRTGDTNLRFYITTVQDGWRKSAFLTRACFPCTVHLIMQYKEPVSEWPCWRMFIETWPHSELTFRHRASSI